MERLVELWIHFIFKMSVSNVPKNREVSLDIIEVSLELLLRKQDYVRKLLLEELNNKVNSKP